ncbi:MAG: TIGR04283 family arsenosugar biosynthesis glycosyltransferase [Nitrospira sp.]|nr:glycosyltransferase [Candidatus Manganitrophaceae bacterium]HIL34533.1 glycosyltransferase [Candidatus Manganitrophaceae bacterium]
MNSISVIVPVLNEEKILPLFLAHLERFSMAEVLIIDGGSDDQTHKVLRDWASASKSRTRRIVCSAPRSRAEQMNEGAKQAAGDIFLFLHSDSFLPSQGFEAILSALQSPSTMGGAFRLRIDSPLFFLKMISVMANLRSVVLKLPYGDQGVFVRRDTFIKLGGYREMPLMEDIDFIRRLSQEGHVILLKESVTTSPRRWAHKGYFYTSFRNIVLFVLYYLGVSPLRLAKWYHS